ncbi:MAG: O-antigen ligase family protein [Candidatus Magasanikbacteria bacterium]|nr:O-antigen ligase family protein [Candidatus Magasanikbacteria bacterium]
MITLYYTLIIVALAVFTITAWRNFYFALAIFFFILPTYLIRFYLGPLPTTFLEIMIGIIFLAWLGKIGPKQIRSSLADYYRQYSTLFWAVGLFLTGATIAVFTAINFRAALGEWKAFYVEPVIIFLIVITACGQDKKYANRILFALILGGLVTAILAVYQYFTGWLVPYSFWENRHTYRVTGWYGFPNAVGLFLAPLFMLAIYYVKKMFGNNQETATKNQTMLLFFPFSLLAIWYAKSTGALVGIIAGIGFLLLLWPKTRWFAMITGALLLLSLILLPNNALKQELLLEDQSGQLRVEMWGETIEFLKTRPVLGAGLASYSARIAPYRINKAIEIFHHPHNIFLTMWVNIGLIGLIGFVWILIWFFHVAWHRQAHYLAAAMVTWVTTGLVDSPYIKNDLAIVFWLLPALLLIHSTLDKKQKIYGLANP